MKYSISKYFNLLGNKNQLLKKVVTYVLIVVILIRRCFMSIPEILFLASAMCLVDTLIDFIDSFNGWKHLFALLGSLFILGK